MLCHKDDKISYLRIIQPKVQSITWGVTIKPFEACKSLVEVLVILVTSGMRTGSNSTRSQCWPAHVSQTQNARLNSTQLNWYLSWVESDRKSVHSKSGALNTRTTEKSEIDEKSLSFLSVVEFWTFAEFPRMSWIGRAEHAQNCQQPVVIQFFSTDQ